MKQLRVAHVKVARSVIEELDGGTDAEAIVAAITGPGRSLTMTIAAEGVEAPGQAHRLARLGCDGAQGFLYASAVPAVADPGLLARFGRV